MTKIKTELEEYLQMFSILWNLPLIGMALVTADGVIAEANHHFYRILGVTPKDALLKTFTSLTAEEYKHEDNANAKLVSSGAMDDYQMFKEYDIRGRRIPVHLSVYGIRRSGQFEYYFAIIQPAKKMDGKFVATTNGRTKWTDSIPWGKILAALTAALAAATAAGIEKVFK